MSEPSGKQIIFDVQSHLREYPLIVHAKPSAFVRQVQKLEERMFEGLLDPSQPKRLKSPGYSWLYRPSHHMKSGLVTEADIERLKGGAHMLSVGAYPAALEQTLVALGVPESSLCIGDKLPEIMEIKDAGKTLHFDLCNDWPNTGAFDVIIFPESLCIAIDDHLPKGLDRTERDAREAELLAHVLSQALNRLNPGGEIRANGPMSHPAVVKRAAVILAKERQKAEIAYARFFLRVQHRGTAAPQSSQVHCGNFFTLPRSP